jgi:hypothetical protein
MMIVWVQPSDTLRSRVARLLRAVPRHVLAVRDSLHLPPLRRARRTSPALKSAAFAMRHSSKQARAGPGLRQGARGAAERGGRAGGGGVRRRLQVRRARVRPIAWAAAEAWAFDRALVLARLAMATMATMAEGWPWWPWWSSTI